MNVSRAVDFFCQKLDESVAVPCLAFLNNKRFRKYCGGTVIAR